MTATVGRYRQKLADKLSTYGFSVLPERIYVAEGAWRSARWSDAYRWEAHGRSYQHPTLPDGIEITLKSWETVTACSRTKAELVFDADGATIFEVFIKGK